MKYLFLFLIMISVNFSFVVAEKKTDSAYSPDYITIDSLAFLVKNDTQFVLIDVRTQKEFDKAHIKGAILIPHTEVDSTDKIPSDTNTLIVFYCNGFT